jgi:processive 1,2-diacylglycerol beta-glucosyltransferase
VKKLLILSASVGGGHDSVARALHECCSDRFGDRLSSVWFDSLSTNRLARAYYVESYRFLTDRAPRLLATLYARTYDDADGIGRRANDRLARVLLGGVRSLIDALRPDLIVCTHFPPVSAVPPPTPTYVVIPDHDCHAMWLDPSVRGYFVADERVRDVLVHRGVRPDAVVVTGIPIKASFSRRYERRQVRAGLALDDRPVVLLMGSAFGAPALQEAFERLRQLTDVQVVVVCGANERVRRALEPLADDRIRVLGLRDDVSALMDGADVLVSKAGGVTVSEALAKGLPMVLFRPIPGQEERNAAYAVDAGGAIRAETGAELTHAVESILTSSERRNELCAAGMRAARPDAARAILDRLAG